MSYPDRNPMMPRGRAMRATAAVAIVSAAALMAGCANRDSIVVGSVPDDYRTNHPIVISERDVVIDIPVGLYDQGLGEVQKVAIDGFIADYDGNADPVVTILVPSGSANEVAASNVAAGLHARMRKAGVPRDRIIHRPYDARSYGETAPIRVTYSAMKASTDRCGRWPKDLLDNDENRHWANFGCSYQNNIAAQIANPADLLGPRKPGDIDAERRAVVISGPDGNGGWRANGSPEMRDVDIDW